jgi:formylglycine-generating enzyme required for sulfatase activity
VNLTWNDATRFCKWLSENEGARYRLPTEAEWEYACRAGATTSYHNGDDPRELKFVGNVADESLRLMKSDDKSPNLIGNDGHGFPAPVGSYKANSFQLHDMHGNVMEWCSDWHLWTYYGNSPSRDPKGPSRGTGRVLRGSGWYCLPMFCRSAHRSQFPPDYCSNHVGFRVVREQ